MRRTLMAALCALVMASPLATAAPAQASHEAWGSASARDQRMHRGCHEYPYHYRVTTPPGHWSTEIFLIGPRGGRVGSAYYVTGSDPATGAGAWRLCRPSLVLGRFTMRMKVSYIDGYDLRTAWAEPSHFRITRR
jgi:hypothetical protein